MRQVYAHQAVLVPAPEESAVAAALADHDVVVHLRGDRLRLLFAAEPHRVDRVRSLIDEALTAGGWELISSGCTRVAPEERPEARRLLRAKMPKSE
ncbi:hypothetical protein AB0C07_31545 [Actinoplanes missouriensis]|uniref:hypothetical protein n=1 Tax=Actinoplanes missouriensis TaxID=1866 RepID=UPI0033C27DD9